MSIDFHTRALSIITKYFRFVNHTLIKGATLSCYESRTWWVLLLIRADSTSRLHRCVARMLRSRFLSPNYLSNTVLGYELLTPIGYWVNSFWTLFSIIFTDGLEAFEKNSTKIGSIKETVFGFSLYKDLSLDNTFRSDLLTSYCQTPGKSTRLLLEIMTANL